MKSIVDVVLPDDPGEALVVGGPGPLGASAGADAAVEIVGPPVGSKNVGGGPEKVAAGVAFIPAAVAAE